MTLGKRTKLPRLTAPAIARGLMSVRCIYTFVLVTLMCMLALSEPLMAATYYVSRSGVDTNPGTEAQPWLTIQKAANTVVAGDTVYVQSGTYNELVKCETASGTEDSPITFIASGAVTNFGWYFSKPYYVVQGFTVTGETVPAYQGTFSITKPAQGTKLINNVVAHSSSVANVYGIWMQHGDYGVNPSKCVVRGNRIIDPAFHALSIQGQGHVIEGNYFTGTKGWDAIRALSSNTIYRGNTFDNWSNLTGNSNHPDIIQAFNSNGEIVTNVIFEKNIATNCFGAQICNFEDQKKNGTVGGWIFRNNIFANVSMACNIYTRDMGWYNNTFYKCTQNTGHPLLFRSSTDRGNADNGKVLNNIFVECGSYPANPICGWYWAFDGISNFQADYNLVVGAGAGTTKTGFQEQHGLNGMTPLFVDPEHSDFRLQQGSPAIKVGENLFALFSDDFSGNMRSSNNAWELGAFTFAAEQLTPPQRLRLESGTQP